MCFGYEEAGRGFRKWEEIGWLLFAPALFLFYSDGQNFQIAVRKLVNAEPVILWGGTSYFCI